MLFWIPERRVAQRQTMSVEPETEQRAADAPGAGHRTFRFGEHAGLLLAPAAFAVDQLTKLLVRNNFELGESWPATGFLRLTYGTNTGTAFGLFPNQTLVLILASFVAIGFLVYFYRAHAPNKPLLRAAIGMQLGGALGNLVDRLWAGAVVDFIDVGPWPIFNVADSCIVVGMIVLVSVLVLAGRDERREGAGDSGGGGPP